MTSPTELETAPTLEALVDALAQQQVEPFNLMMTEKRVELAAVGLSPGAVEIICRAITLAFGELLRARLGEFARELGAVLPRRSATSH